MRLLDYASASRCPAGNDVCRRVHALEPTLPIRPTFDTSHATPCIVASDVVDGCAALPAVHVLAGWHMLTDDVKGFFFKSAIYSDRLDIRPDHACFNMWRTSADALRWVQTWGRRPMSNSTLMVTDSCGSKVMTWQPEYAGRYWSAPFEMRERTNNTGTAAAIQTHDEAMGTKGIGTEPTPPFVMLQLYHSAPVRIIATLRNPVDRLETAFWFHKQFWSVYGPTASGLHAYASEQVRDFTKCSDVFGTRRCAFLFERLGPSQAQAFWHCNQIIRGLYEPFVAEWHAAFAAHGKERAAGRHSSLLVLRVEDMLDRPSTSRAALQEFLFGVHGGGGDDKTADARAATAGPSSTRSYADSHAASMNVSCCGGGRGAPEQMLQSTRDVLSGFYRPHNARLAALLGDDRFLLWDT